MTPRAQARQLRQAIRTLERITPRTSHRLAASHQPFDSLLLSQSPLYRLSRERFLAQGGVLEPALLSSPRSLSGAILLENRIQYSPTEAELIWTARDPREDPARLLDLRTYTTSLFHEQSHRLLWPLLPPPRTDQGAIRRYLNFAESLVVSTDMALADALGPALAHRLYLVGSIYDPGTTILKTLRRRTQYRRYLLAATHATYLTLELYDPVDIQKIIRVLFGGDTGGSTGRFVERATERALRLDRQFVLRTNPLWQDQHSSTVRKFFGRRARGLSPSERLDLPDDPFQHGQNLFWAERWFDEMRLG